jgi:hypothetical protein
MACGNRTFNTEQEYYAWINKAENGLVKERYVNHTHFKVNLLPSDLLLLRALKTLPSAEQADLDSISRDLQHSTTFVITIGPDQREQEGRRDIVFSGVASYEEYRDKLMRLNFEMEEMILLKVGNEQLKPALTNFENVYGLTDHRKVNLVFVAKNEEQGKQIRQGDLELLFDDRIFNTGINRFVFRRADIEEVPNINLPQI